MKNNLIVLLFVVFSIIRLFTKASKKKQQQPKQNDTETLRKLAIDQARKKRLADATENLRTYSAPAVKKIDIPRISVDSTDFESAYAAGGYDDSASNTLSVANTDGGSDNGVTSAGYKETKEERAAYDAPKQMPSKLLPNFSASSYRQFMITKEVFDKPKSMQR